MKVQCFLQKFTSCCTARDLRMLQIKIFISNSAQEIIQTNKNGGFASHMQIKTTHYPGFQRPLAVQPSRRTYHGTSELLTTI